MKNLTKVTESRFLSELLRELQTVGAVSAISERVDRAFHSFGFTQLGMLSHGAFIDTVARFTRHMYEHGLAVPRTMTRGEALSEGLDLLDRYYESGETRGLEAGYLDACDASGRGIEFVLRQLAEIVKELEVYRYRNSLFLLAIDPIDGEAHLRIVKSLAESYGPMLPTNLTNENPWRFARYYRDLIEAVVSTNQFIMQIRNSSITNSNA